MNSPGNAGKPGVGLAGRDISAKRLWLGVSRLRLRAFTEGSLALRHLHWSSDHLKGGLPRLAKSASRHGEVAGGSKEHIFDLGRQHPVALAFGLARDPFRI